MGYPGLGHGVQGRSGGLASRFRPQHTRGGPGGLAPGLVGWVRAGVGKLFSARATFKNSQFYRAAWYIN